MWREEEELNDAVEGPPNNQGTIFIDTLIASLNEELAALRQETRLLEQELDSRDDL